MRSESILPEKAAEAVIATVEHVVPVDHPEEAGSIVIGVEATTEFVELLGPRVICCRLTGVTVRLAVTEHSRRARPGTPPQRAPVIINQISQISQSASSLQLAFSQSEPRQFPTNQHLVSSRLIR